MRKKILSFDCAHRSLAYTLADVDVSIISTLNDLALKILKIIHDVVGSEILQQLIEGDSTNYWFKLHELREKDKPAVDRYIETFARLIVQVNEHVEGFIKIEKYGVVDVLGGLNTDSVGLVYRSRCLKSTLDNLLRDDDIDNDTIVLIEDQPKAKNFKSSGIQSQLCLYYADNDIYLMDPKKKNKINFTPELTHEKFLEAYTDSYDANKMHSTANFIHLIENLGIGLNIFNTIDDSNYDDLADSFMQIMVFIFEGPPEVPDNIEDFQSNDTTSS